MLTVPGFSDRLRKPFTHVQNIVVDEQTVTAAMPTTRVSRSLIALKKSAPTKTIPGELTNPRRV